MLVAGDTHLELLELRGETLFLNPGSPTLPHHKEFRLGTVGLLELSPDAIRAEIVLLGDSDGSPNPGTASRLDVARVDGRMQRSESALSRRR